MPSLITQIEQLKIQREMETVNSNLSFNELVKISFKEDFSNQARIAILNKKGNK